MSRTDYGRAYKIREADLRSYDRTTPPRKQRPNPMGVTTLVRVNGPGARSRAGSARAAAQGQTPAQRMAAARRAMKGKGAGMQKNARRGHRAAFVSSMKKNKGASGAKRRGQRLAAYNAAKRRGMSANSATRSAIRKVPFTQNERRKGSSFKGSKARMRPNQAVHVKPRTKTRIGGVGAIPRKSTKRKRRRTEAQKAASRKNIKKAQAKRRAKSKAKGKRKAKRAKPKSKRRAKAKSKRRRKAKAKLPAQHRRVTKTRRQKKTVVRRVKYKGKQRVAFGRYKRVRLTNPRTGKREYSYMYRDKKGQLRKIPYGAIAGKSDKAHAKYQKARERAANRMMKRGGPFVANPKKRKKARKRRGKQTKADRSRAAKLGHRRRKAKKQARRKTTKRRSTKRRTTKRRAKRRTTKRRAKRRTTKRRSTKRRATKRRSPKRRATKRRSPKRRAKRRSTKRRSTRMKSNRRSKRRSPKRRTAKRRSRRRMTANQIGAMFKKVMKAGLLISAGFLTHRLLTSLACNYLVPLLKPAPAPAAAGQLSLSTFEKPLVGLGVLGLGVPLAAAVAKGSAVQLGAGMVASWAQSLVVSVLQALEAPSVAAQFEGYSNSRAYALRGSRRRGTRGVGQYGQRRGSIMPRYASVGQYTQAAAGMGQYRQASAGWLGEYFKPNSVGEYFAPNSVQGVGQYEPAGPLAMQASAGTGQVIDDGIRPDSNLDNVMDLAESAAGLHGGTGEFFTAGRDNGGYGEQRVPTQNQWVPSGPLWAGTLGVRDTHAQADLPAGILAGPGGNGILSGG